MRPHVPLFGAALLVGALTTVVFAQPRTDGGVGAPTRRDASVATARDATARDATARDATTTSATPDAGRPRAGMDAGRSADAAATDASAASSSDARWPMRQVGEGTVIHFPIPEQFVRTAVPVFAQVRSSAPIDHVSLFYRGLGARRYTEVRMSAMGQQFRLGGGYGAQIPCEDIFPPRVMYYVEAYDSSNTPNGHAGSLEAPIEIPIVEQRTYPAPTLPGQPPPRTCGSFMAAATTVRDAGARDVEPERGTADLGEPCRSTQECRHGLRCGSNNQCVFDR